MSIRYIDNITIMARVGESVNLPSTLIVRRENGTYQTASVSWSPNIVNTSVEGEFIFQGTVSGYAHKVLCSVAVGDLDHNPPSVFPNGLDSFGIPKQDIQTADIPDIDDYQYFKAKMPRTLTEEYQLEQLRELLADKIILARDINHQRNAIYEIEKYCLQLGGRVANLETRVTNVEQRVRTLESEITVDGNNLGNGAEVFRRKRNRRLDFRTLVGQDGIQIEETSDTIIIKSDSSGEGEGGDVGCGVDVKGASFEVCDTGVEFPVKISDSMLKFSGYFNMQMVKIRNHAGSNPPFFYSLLHVMGQGADERSMVNAGRMLKASDRLIIEFRAETNRFVGIELNQGGVDIYETATSSRINAQLVDVDAYSSDVRA